jgi:hypothetical protein
MAQTTWRLWLALALAKAKRPRDIADQIRDLRNYRKVKGNDSLIRETFTLPLEQARTKARQILDAYPAGGYMTIVENWRQLPDGQIEFTMRRLPTADWHANSGKISIWASGQWICGMASCTRRWAIARACMVVEYCIVPEERAGCDA